MRKYLTLTFLLTFLVACSKKQQEVIRTYQIPKKRLDSEFLIPNKPGTIWIYYQPNLVESCISINIMILINENQLPFLIQLINDNGYMLPLNTLSSKLNINGLDERSQGKFLVSFGTKIIHLEKKDRLKPIESHLFAGSALLKKTINIHKITFNRETGSIQCSKISPNRIVLLSNELNNDMINIISEDAPTLWGDGKLQFSKKMPKKLKPKTPLPFIDYWSQQGNYWGGYSYGIGLIAIYAPKKDFQDELTGENAAFYKKKYITNEFSNMVLLDRLAYCCIPGSKEPVEIFDSSLLIHKNGKLYFKEQDYW